MDHPNEQQADGVRSTAEMVHPISWEAAHDAAQRLVGIVFRTSSRFCTDKWWDRLRAAQTPEEKLTCERMITALNYARGLHHHEMGAALAARNRELLHREEREESERQAIDRWR